MKITLLAFAVIFFAACTYAQSSPDITTDDSSSASPTTAPTVTSTVSSSSAPTTVSSSSLAPTTTSPSTSSETTTTSSTSSEPTTTSSTSSEPTTTSSTSSEPTTSTTPETTTSHETTSVAPTSSTEPPTPTTPPPVPQPGYWNVTDGNTTCIRANLAIRFKVELTSGGVQYVEVLPTASTEGSTCNTSDGTEVLKLRDAGYEVAFVFEKSSDNVYLKNTTLEYTLSPSEAGTFTNDTHFFEVKSGSSYLCKTTSDIILGNATMEIFSVQIQAFGAEYNKDFGSAEECGADHPINDIVPIAVGVALLALVIVVLIAYLVGRRRSRQKGYQSV